MLQPQRPGCRERRHVNERGAAQVFRFTQFQAACERRRHDRSGPDRGKVVGCQAFKRSVSKTYSGVKSLELEIDVAAGAFNRQVDVRIPVDEAGQQGMSQAEANIGSTLSLTL